MDTPLLESPVAEAATTGQDDGSYHSYSPHRRAGPIVLAARAPGKLGWAPRRGKMTWPNCTALVPSEHTIAEGNNPRFLARVGRAWRHWLPAFGSI
jgi:hypothetical protein